MKKILSIIFAAAFSFTAYAQNPYEVFGYKSNVNYDESRQDLFRVANTNPNDNIKFITFNFEIKTVELLDKNDSIIQTLNIDNEKLLRWLSVDPKAANYPGSSPYNYVDNNPVQRIDVDGRDWIVSTTQVNGQTQVKITFAGAIMNSSGKPIDMQKLIDNQVKQFASVFGQGNVIGNLRIREVKSSNELSWHESLIDIQAPSSFPKREDGSIVGGESRYGGKFIRMNAAEFNSDGSLVDNKALVHEMGHTGGLMHPWEFGANPKVNFVNGNTFSEGVQGFSINNLDDATNFMGYTKWGVEQSDGLINPMLSPAQKQNYFNNTVGQATQGQTQQIINNVYKGNLNSENDIPKKK